MHLRAGCGDVIVSEIPDKLKETYEFKRVHVRTEEPILTRQENIVY